MNDYIKARKAGLREVQRDISRGRYPYLTSLEDFVSIADTAGEYPVGLVEIPISMIAGTKTKGRQNAFSRGFLPVLEEASEFAAKWQKLVEIQETEGIRDAVKVYEYMQKFYVEEGNKRVSVTKYMNMPMILADVTRILPRKTDDKYNKIYYEFTRFYNVAPIYDISFSEEGGFEKLAEIAGQTLDQPWPEDTLQTVRSAYQYFSELFAAKGGEDLSVTTGDAFLIYLSIFSLDSLLNENKTELERRINSIWNEILTKNRDDNIEVVEDPDMITKAGSPKSAAGTVISALIRKNYTEEHPLRAAFIYDRTAEESSWIYGHELGRNAVDQRFGGVVETIKFEGCAGEEEFRKAVQAAVADDDDLVFTVSPAQMAATLRAAIEYPKVKFMNCSVNLSHNAVRTYYGRMYEAKFLMGALAASVAENHRIGYRADYPIYGTFANINAFAIGAAMIDPKAEIELIWSTKKDTDWRAEMREMGVSVYSGPDLIRPQEASREYGIYKRDEAGNVLNLAAPMWDWGRYYELIIRTILDDTWNAKDIARPDQALNYWWGMQSGVIDVIMSEHISYYSKKLVGALRHGLITDTLNPFDGELRSQDGLIKPAGSPRLSNLEIIKMDWLNDNVNGTIPEIGELNDSVKETVQVVGVVKDAQAGGTPKDAQAGSVPGGKAQEHSTAASDGVNA